jgi:hypothetical protein
VNVCAGSAPISLLVNDGETQSELLDVDTPADVRAGHLSPDAPAVDVIVNDDLIAIAQELVRLDQFKRVHIGLDYFDASINRIAAWVIGVRAMQRALVQSQNESIAPLIHKALKVLGRESLARRFTRKKSEGKRIVGK